MGIFDSFFKNPILSPSGTPTGNTTGGYGDIIMSLLPSVAGGITSTFGNIASNEYSAEQAEKARKDKLFELQLGLMKDLATIPGGSSSSSWQEGGTGNLTDAQRLAAMRQGSADKISQYNNLLSGFPRR